MGTLKLSNTAVDWIGQLRKVSSNGRYMTDGSGKPVLYLSDSPQGMLVATSLANAETYLSTRATQGFNCTQVHSISGPSFGGGANFETFDGIHPFTVDGDISTPNNTYFAKLDSLIQMASTYGIIVMLTTAETIDAKTMFTNNGNTKCYNFGAYMGNRYRRFPNIVWNIGNDFQDWSTNTAARNALLNVIDGIKSVDSIHLHTAWLDYYRSATRDSTDFNGKCELDFGYTYYVSYDKIAEEYALGTPKPVFLGETYYENYSTLSLTGNPFLMRKQNYWGMLAGACGVNYMSVNWDFHTGWQTDLTLTGATQVAHLKSLFTNRPWWNLVPDTTNQVLTAGYGTKRTGTVQPDTDDYSNCAWIMDGSLALIYMPENMTFTVNMSKFKGTVTARWYDPTNGSFTADAASPLTNSGTHNFSRASTNNAGETDWVLVLEA